MPKSRKFWIILGLVSVVVLVWATYTVASMMTKAQFTGYEATHPFFAMVKNVIDGDTLTLDDGRLVRLIGINAPERGAKNFDNATKILTKMVEGKPIWLEYDRETDKYGRLLAWVWIGCEGKPEFKPLDYMVAKNNETVPGLFDNPEGCKQGQLVNEQMIRKGMVVKLFYKDSGELKYQKRLGG